MSNEYFNRKFSVTHDRSIHYNNAEIGMYACMHRKIFDHLRISYARKHDNSVWSIHTKNVNNDDDDYDELSMSFVICFQNRQLVLECIVLCVRS